MNETNTAQPDALAGFGFTLDVAPKAKATKGKATTYPKLPDPDGLMAKMAAEYKLAKEKLESCEGTMDRIKPHLLAKATPFWFKHCASMAEPPSSVSISSPEGELLVTLPDKYGAIVGGAAAVHAIVGPDILKANFKPTFIVKVNSDDLPESPVTQQLLNEVLAVFKRHGLEGAFQFSPSIKPRKGFAADRHRVLSPEMNEKLNGILPIIAMVKCKGRGE